jgi:carbonic anhydrase
MDMSNLTCDAIVVTCIDFRFHKYVHDWMKKNHKNMTYDLVGIAGCAKDFKLAKKQIDTSRKLHNIKNVFLIHHEGCGAYGIDSTRENHSRDLIRARDTILSEYSNLNVRLYYVYLDGRFEMVI